jgi:hypothetical protein
MPTARDCLARSDVTSQSPTCYQDLKQPIVRPEREGLTQATADAAQRAAWNLPLERIRVVSFRTTG